jgi:Tfp pilus assembly protein PilF
MSKEKASANAIEQAISEAEALWKEGKEEDAIEKLEAFRRRCADDLDILRKLACMYFRHYEAEVGEKAAETCLAILRIEPEDIETRLLLALTYWIRLLEYDKALEEYRRVIEMDPSQVEAYRGIAAVFPNAGSAEEAIEALQKAIELQPNHGELYNNLASMYSYLGEHEKELEWLEKALEKGTYDQVGARRRIAELKEKLKKG